MNCINSIKIYPKDYVLQVGESMYLCASVYPETDDDICISWHSDNESVATVNPSSGYVLAQSAGEAKIYATATDCCGGASCSEYITVTVEENVLIESILLSQNSITLGKGTSYNLYATVYPADANNKTLKWHSSNTSIATVTNGRVRAIAGGTAVITATAVDGSVESASCIVTVPTYTVSVSPETHTMKVDDVWQPTVTVYPENTGCHCVLWYSDNESVASVNPSSGCIFANSPGTARIYATMNDCTCDDSSCDYITVTVEEKVYVDSVCFCQDSIRLEEGACTTLNATVKPSGADNKSLNWCSNNINVARVIDGKIYGVSSGTAVISATARDGSGKTAYCTVTVYRNIPICSIEVSPKEYTLKEEKSFTATATICPGNASCNTLSWYSENEDIASVNPYSGYIFANTPGTTRIFAKALDGKGNVTCSDYITVTVEAKIPVESISINTNRMNLEMNCCSAVPVTVLPENADNKKLQWFSDNSEIAMVYNGRVCGVSNGTTTITARAADGSGAEASVEVVVFSEIPITELYMSDSHLLLYVDDYRSIDASKYPQNATFWPTWHNSNPSVVELSPEQRLHALAPGVAVITATAENDSSITTTCEVTVIPKTAVYPDRKLLKSYETANLSLGTSSNTASVEWTSEDSSIVRVDSAGTISGRSPGTAKVSASINGEVIGSCTVTVDNRERAHVIKDSHSFYIQFEDSGRIWKNIGKDLELEPDNGYTWWQPEHYQYLSKEVQRYIYNREIAYTKDEIAYLYRFDPLGIEYYMRKDAGKEHNGNDYLFFKDRVYQLIFGSDEINSGRFYFKQIDGEPVYGYYDNETRDDVYSNAEVLFGGHPIFDWGEFFKSAISTAVLTFIFKILPDGYKTVAKSINVTQQLFYSASITGTANGVATLFLEKIIGSCANSPHKWMGGVASVVVDIIMGALDSFEFIDSDHKIVYSKVQENQKYMTIYENGNYELSLGEIIEKCN